MPDDPLLDIRGLKVAFHTPGGSVTAVDDVSLSLRPGQALGLVGESGSGKSVTALSVLRLLPTPPAEIQSGSITFAGESLLDASPRRMREIRGGEIAMIFQDPMTSLNPVMTVGEQVAEAVRLHRKVNRREAWARAVAALQEMGLRDAAARAKDYPHQFSGGMRQRVMIAMAVACDPRLLIADEPTTALDVTVQAEILGLLRRLREERGLSILLITHDLGVVAEFCDEVAVMYAGQIVERAPARVLFESPKHPYTRGLLASTPDLEAAPGESFRPIPGSPPQPEERSAGCPFHPRCPDAMTLCAEENPESLPEGASVVRCHLHSDPQKFKKGEGEGQSME
ncbi:MAG: ABC transporter ATP-binding protein [Armatimonadetes bacterium]|nr:ABC transporter ATP-binding protein [Armatimonadota bacterium]